jgi:hypothetical protein
MGRPVVPDDARVAYPIEQVRGNAEPGECPEARETISVDSVAPGRSPAPSPPSGVAGEGATSDLFPARTMVMLGRHRSGGMLRAHRAGRDRRGYGQGPLCP